MQPIQGEGGQHIGLLEFMMSGGLPDVPTSATGQQKSSQASHDSGETNAERFHGNEHLLSCFVGVVPAPLMAGPGSAPLELRQCESAAAFPLIRLSRC